MARDTTHQLEQFSAMIQRLLGEHPGRDILAQTVDSMSGRGKSVWIDSIDPLNSDDASTAATADVSTRAAYFESGSTSFATYLNTKTPHDQVKKERTLSSPYKIEWGTYIDEDEEWLDVVDPRGPKAQTGVQKVYRDRTELFIARALADTVQRKKTGSDSLQTISKPAGQVLDDITYANVNINTMTNKVLEKFRNVFYAAGQPIYMVVSATLARHLRANSRQYLNSTDFVSSYAHFASGSMPQVDGITLIEIPNSLLSPYATGDAVDTYFAYCPMAIRRVDYTGMKVSMDNSIDHRYDTVIYMRENIDFRRIDDLGVVYGDVIAAT
jgi:hypothetical protein